MDTAAASPVKDEIMYRRHGLVNRVGRDFLLASAAGTALHSVLGYRSAPAGGRLAGAACAALKKAPYVGGFYAAYSVVFYVFEGAIARARGRHDRWNTAAASGAAFGLLQVPLTRCDAVVSVVYGAAVGGMFGEAMTTIGTKTSVGSISIDDKKKGS